MPQIKIASGAYALKGTNGENAAWVPGWNRYVNLLKLTPEQAAELVEMKFPYVVKLDAEVVEDSTPDSFKKLKLDELKALAAEKGLDEELYKDLTKKDEIIALLIG